MIPSTAALNGPSSSDSVNADRLGLVRDLILLDSQIDAIPLIVDPARVSIPMPALTSSFSIPLPSFAFNYGGVGGRVGACTLALNAFCDNYVNVTPTGLDSVPAHFPANSFVWQPASSTWLLQGTGAISSCSVDISLGQIFWTNYTCYADDPPGSGWGPTFTDQDGNGYYCRFNQHGGQVYQSQDGVITPIFNLPDHAVTPNTTAQLSFGIQWFEGQLNFFVRVNSLSVILAQNSDATPILNPESIFPGFMCNGAYVFFPPGQSNWQNADKSPVLCWTLQYAKLGAKEPGLPTGGTRFFSYSLAGELLGSVPLYGQGQLATQIAGISAILNLIEEAYC